MMTRQKLREVKAALPRSPDVADNNAQLIHALVDSNLAALDELEGGKTVQEHRAELAERERQVRLALADLRTILAGDTFMDDSVDRAVFTVDMIEQMLKAKGPQWHREWSWYSPRIAEEFG